MKTFSKRFPKQVIEKHHFLTPETPHTALLQVPNDSRSEKIKNSNVSITRNSERISNISTKNLNDVTNNKYVTITM